MCTQRWLATSVAALMFTACAVDQYDEPRTLEDAALEEPGVSQFMNLARLAGLDDRLRSGGELTVIAPSDAALAELSDELAELSRPENRDELRAFVESHILDKRMLASEMRSGEEVSLSGNTLDVEVGRGAITVNAAAIAKADITARNGVLFVANRWLFRPGILTYVRILPQLSILNEAIAAAGLRDALRGRGPFTLFAPTNAAFAALLDELRITKAQLLGNRELLVSVLTYHALPQALSSRGIASRDRGTAVTLQGQALTFDVARRDGPDIRLIDATGRSAGVTFANLYASNGVVHVLDRVVLPQSKNLVEIAQSNNDFTLLVEAVVAAGLVDTLAAPGPFTVFAPSNAAFASLLRELGLTKEQLLADRALLTQVLTYHVVPGRVLAGDIKEGALVGTVQGQSIRLGLSGGPSITDARGRRSNIVATNVQAKNGVIHVIDRVVLPQTQNLVQLAQGIPSFSILVEAVVAADLADTLGGSGPFTVFAPSNDAFAALLRELGVTKQQLLADRALLTTVLTYHVLPGRLLSPAIIDGATPSTVQGQKLTLRKRANAVSIVDARHRIARVTSADVQGANGVIHAIDRVILPAAR
jgi:transforming growth factor-beta-induced protein